MVVGLEGRNTPVRIEIAPLLILVSRCFPGMKVLNIRGGNESASIKYEGGK